MFALCVCVCVCVCTHTYTHTHTHIWLRRDCLWIAVATKWHCQWNILTQIGGSAKCWLDIYRWGAGPAVTGRIRDIGQNILDSSFQTGSSSSPSYFQIFLRIAFRQEAFLRYIIIFQWVNYIITIRVSKNNAVINNNLSTFPRPCFALRNSHGHAKRISSKFVEGLDTRSQKLASPVVHSGLRLPADFVSEETNEDVGRVGKDQRLIFFGPAK